MMKKITNYLVFAFVTMFSLNAISQCLPTGARPVFGTVTGSTGTQTFTSIPNGNVIRITSPAIGTFYTIDMCTTNPANSADGLNDSYLTIIDVNSSSATDLADEDDGCSTNVPNGWGPTSMNYTSTTVGDVYIYITEYDAVDACNFDGTNTSYIMTVTKTSAPPACNSGVITTTGSPFTVCPVDSFTVATDGTESTAGDFAILFTPLAGASGAGGVAFNLTGVTFPYTADSDLNGVLSGQTTPLPVLLGEWSMKTRARDGAGIYCSTSADSIIVDFVLASHPTCTPPPTCSAGVLSTMGYPKSICPPDSFILSTDGTETSTGDFAIYFSPQATGAGGLGGAAFSLTGVVFPYTGDYDLGGVLSANGYPVMTGEWVAYTRARDASDVVCSTSTDSVSITFLAAGSGPCAPPPACSAGVLTTTGSPFTVCPVDSFTVATDGTETSAGDFAINFVPLAGATGAGGTAFSLTGVTFPYTANNDLNGVLSGQTTPLPVLLGQWSMKTIARDAANLVCDVSLDSIIVNFVPSTDPACQPPTGTPCITASGGPYNDLNTAGGAPCNDGTSCIVTDPQWDTLAAPIGVYASEEYLLDNVQAGFDYIFDMCSGLNAGAWIPAITIVAPSGNIDTFNLGTTGTFATNCSLEWTATESGTYSIFVHEAGQACTAGAQSDNGTPTVTCGTNPATCVACTPGVLTSASSMTVCSNTIDSIVLNGMESTPGSYTISFDNAAGGSGAGGAAFSLTGVNVFPYVFDNDLNGVLSGQTTPLPPLVGMWDLTIYNIDALGNVCDSVATSISVNFLDSNDVLCNPITQPGDCQDLFFSEIIEGSGQNKCVELFNPTSMDIDLAAGNYAINRYSNGSATASNNVPLTGIVPAGGTFVICNGSADANFVALADVVGGTMDPATYFNGDDALDLTKNSGAIVLDVFGQIGTDPGSSWGTSCITANRTLVRNSNVEVGDIDGSDFFDPSSEWQCYSTNDDLHLGWHYSTCVTFTCNTFTVVETIVADTCGQSNGEISIVVSNGFGNINYVWSDLTSNDDLDSASAGAYYVSIVDDANCNEIIYYTVPSIGVDPVLTSSSTPVSNCAVPDGTATVVVTSANAMPYTYSWNDVMSQTTDVASALPAGNYIATVTDGWGCSATTAQTVTNSSGFSAVLDVFTDVTCNGLSDGVINTSVIGGSPAFTYIWSDQPSVPLSTGDRNNLAAGSYTILITDGNQCTFSLGPIVINEPDVLTVSVSASQDITCNGVNDGSIDVDVAGGNGGNNYMWTNGGGTLQNASSLGANSYVMTVTDSEGCTASTVSTTISEPAAISISIDNQNDVSCFGDNDGNILVTTTGGTGSLSFDWNNAPDVEDAQNIGGGNYQLTVTDDNMCSAQSAMMTITEPDELIVSIDAFTDVSCNSADDGTITASVIGGTGTMNIVWTNGAGTSLIPTGLSANSYQLTVTDVNMCSATSTIVNISDATLLTATVSSTDETNSGNDGTATVVAAGGTPNYTYVWTPTGQTTAAAVGLSAGNYSCAITDEHGCTHSVNIEVSKAVAINEISLADLVIYPNPSNGTFTVQFETGEAMNIEITLINTIGKELFSNSYDNINGNFVEQISINDLSNGIYFLEISNQDAKSVSRITISK